MDPFPDRGHDRPIIIGSGIAGLMTALHCAPEPVILLTKSSLGTDAASAWAQGGIAAALGPDDDPVLHAEDTLACGNGLCDREVVDQITGAARTAIDALIRHGVQFDRATGLAFALGLEAGHRRRRILHAADGTGRTIIDALVAAIRRTPSVHVVERAEARHLVHRDGRITGVVAAIDGCHHTFPSTRVVIATGGLGGLFSQTTNPLSATGSGLALAAWAGAALADMEFVQFHPTALDVGRDPMPLISEAVRGEGAVLIDETGARIMADYPRQDLEPRDVVTRALWQHLKRGYRVFLDARAALGHHFASRFPGINAICLAAGIDPASEPVPVSPAAHYAIGGIKVDPNGWSTVEGLWACGEAACTGLHGASRLASNSLLEAVVMAKAVADDVTGTRFPKPRHEPSALPGGSIRAPAGAPAFIRPLMSEKVGIQRDHASLHEAITVLAPVASGSGASADSALVGFMIAASALRREESRGAHWRTDFPRRSPESQRTTLYLGEAMRMLEEVTDQRVVQSCSGA